MNESENRPPHDFEICDYHDCGHRVAFPPSTLHLCLDSTCLCIGCGHMMRRMEKAEARVSSLEAQLGEAETILKRVVLEIQIGKVPYAVKLAGEIKSFLSRLSTTKEDR